MFSKERFSQSNAVAYIFLYNFRAASGFDYMIVLQENISPYDFSDLPWVWISEQFFYA